MRVVLQRVTHASVSVEGQIVGEIQNGILALVGIEQADAEEEGLEHEMVWLAKKMVNLRIFNDDEGVMNKSLLDTGGQVLVVSQFTLHANTKKGNRPSYVRAAAPEKALELFGYFVRTLEVMIPERVQTGQFGAMMAVSLLNDGPVTIIIDSKNKSL